MIDNNGWPDKPGVPLNPERGGWHWLSLLGGKDNEQAIEWLGLEIGWDHTDWSTEDVGLHARYLGPALTPAEVESRIAAARKDALEEAARECEKQRDFFLSPQYAHAQPGSSFDERFAATQCAASIRALKGEENK